MKIVVPNLSRLFYRVAFPVSHRTTRHGPIVIGCYPFGFGNSCAVCNATPVFHSTTTSLHPDGLPLGFLEYTDRATTGAVTRLSSRKAQELGTLHSALDQPLLFNPDPSPSFPGSAGTHTDVLILGRLFDLAINQIRTPVCPLWRDGCLSGLRRLPTLTSDSSPNVYSRHAP